MRASKLANMFDKLKNCVLNSQIEKEGANNYSSRMAYLMAGAMFN
jgi:hypothetical protein